MYVDLKKNSAGFTLIEAVVYIALLGLIMGGTLMTVYQLLQGGANINSKTSIHDEANFVLRKISWALSHASSASLPSSVALRVVKYDGTQVDICLDSSDPLKKMIKMREGNVGIFVCTDSSFLPLTTDNVIVNNLQFQSIGSNSLGVGVTITINGIDFVITKYLRE